MNETEVKYLAGLIDADGYIGFEFRNNRCSLAIQLSAAESIDKHGYVLGLPETIGYGSSCIKGKKHKNWARVTSWKVTKRKEVEMLAPRLIKHLVIKGKHLQRMLDKWLEYQGKELVDIEIEQLKVYSKASRADTGPVKPKKHPTWAWVAGYLDGDGSYIFSHPPSYKKPKILIQATAHENDRVGLELLLKAFKGRIETRGKAAPHILDWRHSLNIRDRAFAIKFLSKMVQHSKLKKHKIEQILAFHNSCSTDLHRLSEVSPAGEAIVGT